MVPLSERILVVGRLTAATCPASEMTATFEGCCQQISSMADGDPNRREEPLTRLTVPLLLDTHVDELRTRLDKAAIVMRDTIFDVRGLKARMTTGATVTDAQAAEIATLVKTIATALTARDSSTPEARRGSAYGTLYDALYRQFDVTSYKRVRVEDYAAVIAWLEEYARAAGVAGGQARADDTKG